MEQNCFHNLQPNFMFSNCRKWFAINKKIRKESNWDELYSFLFTLIFPDINADQLLISQNQLFDSFQILLSSAFTWHQKQTNSFFEQSPLLDFVLLLSGKLQYNNQNDPFSSSNYEILPNSVVNVASNVLNKQGKVLFYAFQKVSYLLGQKKVIQKYKTQILRQDRESKESFLSNNLFCNFTPSYYLKDLTKIIVKEHTWLEISKHQIFILYGGSVQRRNKDSKSKGTILTKGCVLSYKEISKMLHINHLFSESETLYAIEECQIITFQIQEFTRIVNSNLNLKQSLKQKLHLIAHQRQEICSKAANSIDRSSKIENQILTVNYPITFKSKTKANCSSFRSKCEYDKDVNYEDFITFNRYEKLMESKQKIELTKQIFRICEEQKQKPVVKMDQKYMKKMKRQSKMMKIQSFKIQKISQSESYSQCTPTQVQEIQKNLNHTKNIFEDEVQFLKNDFKSLNKSRTFMNLQNYSDNKMLGRVSILKPQQYLKDKYLNEFTSKSRLRYSLKQNIDNQPFKNMQSTRMTVNSTNNKIKRDSQKRH